MKKVLIATAVAVSLSLISIDTVEAQSQATPKKQDPEATKTSLVSFGTGATAGIMIGGPLGGIIGGVFGIFVANDINTNKTLESNQQQMASLNEDLSEQSDSFLALQQQYAALEQSQMLQLASFDTKASTEWMYDLPALESNVQFRTASFSIEDTFKGQLNSLAGLLNQYPNLKVELSGFADMRGDSQYNQALSQQRADSVKEYLLKQNVKASQVITTAQGEQTATSASDTLMNINNSEAGRIPNEALFFDRRVTLQIIQDKASLSAAN
jgi:sortase system peptidoglycan-associated protein